MDYQCIDYVGDLNEFEAHVFGNCLAFRSHLQLCGVASEDVDLERMMSDLVRFISYLALACNSYPIRSPKRQIATVLAIGRDPQNFRNAPGSYDPVANYMVMSAIARLSAHHEVLVREHQLNEGPGPSVEDITKVVPGVVKKLMVDANNMTQGRPRTFQGGFATNLGIIFKAQGGFLGRNSKTLGKTPFRQFLELLLDLRVLKDIAGRAGISLNPTTMISTARKNLDSKLSK